MSDPSAVSSLRSSAPKNGANVLVLITSVPNGNSSRLTSPLDVSSTDPCSAIRVPSARSTATPRAPTIRAIAGSTRSATSCSLVADISSPMASCIRRCSGRRHRSRRPFGRREPEHERDRAQRGEEPRHEREHRVVVAARRGDHERGSERGGRDRKHLHPTARDGCLRPSGAPQAHGHDQQQHRPVDDEGDDVGGEPPRP